MAITVLSSEVKTVDGDLTIPATCDFIVALVLGTNNPTIATVAMTQEISVNGGPSLLASISTKAEPSTGTVACTVGAPTRFVYLKGADSTRDADGSGTGAAVTLDSSATDLILGIQDDDGDSVMTVDGSAMTYLDNFYRGYLASPDDSVICDGDAGANAFISIIAKSVFVPKNHWW